MTQNILVEAKNLVKIYKRKDGTPLHAVKGVDLTIRKGEIFSLLGPNGAGKTTTISMISGLISPTEGDAFIGGYSITRQPLQAKQLLGVVPQEIALYPTLTARQNLDFFGRMYNMGGAKLKNRIAEVLELLDLVQRADDRIDTFSGGMKRRVNIGVGLLHHPTLLYMDEPTVGIDPQSRRRILDTVVHLRDEYGMTILYTTHLMEEAQELSDRVGIMDHGEIIALGTQHELTQQVGQEDRLIFSIVLRPVVDEVLRRIETEIEGVTRALYNAPTTTADEHTATNNHADTNNTNNRAGTDSNTDTDSSAEQVPDDGKLVVYAYRGRRALPQIINIINDARLEISAVEVREPDLEAVFLHLTGRALRD